MKAIALTSILAAGAVAIQDMPGPAAPQEQHKWLQQLVGDWTVTAEATMAPGTDPMKLESTESVRSIGEFWIMAEQTASLMGTPITSILTLGYDPQKEVFVGTWIDSMQAHMWSYVGTLDGAKKVLTLETKGPRFEDPSKITDYRDVIELKSADHKSMTSSLKEEDGSWNTFMRAEFRRKK